MAKQKRKTSGKGRPTARRGSRGARRTRWSGWQLTVHVPREATKEQVQELVTLFQARAEALATTPIPERTAVPTFDWVRTTPPPAAGRAKPGR
jgi:hypothetical protein